MNLDHAFNQVRPILSLIGSAVIVVGVLRFCGVNINILNGSGLEVAAIGFLIKNI